MTSLRTEPVSPERVMDAARGPAARADSTAAEATKESAQSSSVEHDVLGNLVRAYDCLWSEMTKFFQSFDITPQQYNVLKVLAAQDGRVGVACQAIGEQLLNRVPDITRLLDRLEQAGLIWRERCASDRRVVRTHLTDAGRSKVAEVRDPLQRALERRFAHMTGDEVRDLNRLLTKVREPHCPNARAAFLRVFEVSEPE
jgi:DNA-binding MarR family transcriptional regulator